MKPWKTILLCFVVLSFLVFLSSAGVTAAEKVLKIGVLGPYTGPSARTGAEMRAASTQVFKEVDYKIGDYKVELVWIDSAGDPPKASAAYAEAVERFDVQATLNSWHSSVAVACIDVAAKYEVPHYFGPGGSSALVDEKYRSDPKYAGYWLKITATPANVTRGYVDCLVNAVDEGYWKPAQKTVAIWGEDNDWGRGIGEGFKEQFTAFGWQVVKEDYFPMTQTEFYSLLNEYKKLNVAVLAGTTSGTASIAAFIKQAREIALNSVICADGIGYVGEWYKLMGRSADHVLDSAPLFVTPEAKAWKKTMDKQYGLEFGGFGGICYDSNKFFIKIARRALEKYGTIDKKTLHRLNLEEVIPGKITYTKAEGALIMENYKFTPETAPSCIFGPQYYYYPIVQYMAGKPNVVWPEAWKAADFKTRK